MRKRTIWTILAGLVALAIAGLAVAAHKGAQTDPAVASFSATEVKRIKTRTCEGADGTYKITHAIVEGTVASTEDPVLAGNLRLHLKSVYNDTENLGWVTGKAHIRSEGADPDTRATRARASLKAVNVDGEIEGMLVGGAGAPHWKLLANFSASLADTGAVTNGQIGVGSSGNSALLFRGGCHRKADGPAATSERKEKERGHGKGRP
jgi:hypothetical protein